MQGVGCGVWVVGCRVLWTDAAWWCHGNETGKEPHVWGSFQDQTGLVCTRTTLSSRGAWLTLCRRFRLLPRRVEAPRLPPQRPRRPPTCRGCPMQRLQRPRGGKTPRAHPRGSAPREDKRTRPRGRLRVLGRRRQVLPLLLLRRRRRWRGGGRKRRMQTVRWRRASRPSRLPISRTWRVPSFLFEAPLQKRAPPRTQASPPRWGRALWQACTGCSRGCHPSRLFLRPGVACLAQLGGRW